MNRAKTDPIQDTIDMLFSKNSAHSRQPSIAGVGAKAGFKPMSTRFEARADETTRLVREIIDTAADQRLLPPKKASRSRKGAKAAAAATTD
jgi:hypothetical protein